MDEPQKLREPADTGRRAGLSAGVVARAALDLVDEAGLERLTMRGLAGRLNVTPMALYNHVADKDALLGLIVNQIAEEWDAPRRDRTWKDRLGAIAGSLRASYLRHPNALPLLQTTIVTSSAVLEPIELALAALTSAGLTPDMARTAWVGLVGLVAGHVNYQLHGHFSRPVHPATLSTHHPNLSDALDLGPLDYDAAFERAVSWYLNGIESAVG